MRRRDVSSEVVCVHEGLRSLCQLVMSLISLSLSFTIKISPALAAHIRTPWRSVKHGRDLALLETSFHVSSLVTVSYFTAFLSAYDVRSGVVRLFTYFCTSLAEIHSSQNSNDVTQSKQFPLRKEQLHLT